MKIKRFFAPDMRQAIKMIRESQGADAVILSNRKVDGGIEIISALDYDSSLFEEVNPAASNSSEQTTGSYSEPPDSTLASADASTGASTAARQDTNDRSRSAAIEWSQDPAIIEMRNELKNMRGVLEHQLQNMALTDLERNQPEASELISRLTTMDFSREMAIELIKALKITSNIDDAWKATLIHLASKLQPSDNNILDRGGIVALIGATGVGKTTTVAKLAARFALRHGQQNVVLISTDRYRIGAHDHLMTYGRLLGVPTCMAANQAELKNLLLDHADKRLVLIDTAGMSQRDMRLSEQLDTLNKSGREIRKYLVMAANAQRGVLLQTVQAFSRIPLAGCILTKLDEAVTIGGALEAVIKYNLPLAYTSDGQRVPEDIQPARMHTLIAHALSVLHSENETIQTAPPMNSSYNGNSAHAYV